MTHYVHHHEYAPKALPHNPHRQNLAESRDQADILHYIQQVKDDDERLRKALHELIVRSITEPNYAACPGAVRNRPDPVIMAIVLSDIYPSLKTDIVPHLLDLKSVSDDDAPGLSIREWRVQPTSMRAIYSPDLVGKILHCEWEGVDVVSNGTDVVEFFVRHDCTKCILTANEEECVLRLDWGSPWTFNEFAEGLFGTILNSPPNRCLYAPPVPKNPTPRKADSWDETRLFKGDTSLLRTHVFSVDTLIRVIQRAAESRAATDSFEDVALAVRSLQDTVSFRNVFMQDSLFSVLLWCMDCADCKSYPGVEWIDIGVTAIAACERFMVSKYHSSMSGAEWRKILTSRFQQNSLRLKHFEASRLARVVASRLELEPAAPMPVLPCIAVVHLEQGDYKGTLQVRSDKLGLVLEGYEDEFYPVVYTPDLGLRCKAPWAPVRALPACGEIVDAEHEVPLSTPCGELVDAEHEAPLSAIVDADHEPVIALIDAENMSVDTVALIHSRFPHVRAIRAYGDFSNPALSPWKAANVQWSHSFSTGKNSSDFHLCMDAIRVVGGEYSDVDHIVLVTSDGDFVQLVQKLRNTHGKRVTVIGKPQAAERLRAECNNFIEWTGKASTEKENATECASKGRWDHPARESIRHRIQEILTRGHQHCGRLKVMLMEEGPHEEAVRSNLGFRRFNDMLENLGFEVYSTSPGEAPLVRRRCERGKPRADDLASTESDDDSGAAAKTQADWDNYSNQLNPNNEAYWSSRDPGAISGATKTQADWDNYSNQLNPNNDAYWSSRR